MKKIILMYHCVYQYNFNESGFQEGNAWQYKTRVDNFEAQVKAIAEYCVKEGIDKESVEFTFDDGGVSFLTMIAPILEKYDFKGIFYISTKYINTIGFLTEKQIKELYDRGHIIGSHSHSHPKSLCEIPYEEVVKEWNLSKKILEKIVNNKVLVASIPNGNGSKDIYKAALESGFKMLDTSIPTSSEMYLQDLTIRGRFVVHNQTTIEDVIEILSSEKKRKLMYYRWSILSLVKLILGSNYDKLKGLILKNR